MTGAALRSSSAADVNRADGSADRTTLDRCPNLTVPFLVALLVATAERSGHLVHPWNCPTVPHGT